MFNKNLNIFLAIIFFVGCGVEDKNEDPAIFISDPQFNFHQDVNKLYISAKVLPELEGKIVDNVIVEWFGTSQENVPDSLVLKDGGLNGDIIEGDDIYTLKFQNDSTIINNTLGDDSGSVYINILAVYVGQTQQRYASFKIGNIIPRILNVVSPDTYN
jgi:hypothetical protein